MEILLNNVWFIFKFIPLLLVAKRAEERKKTLINVCIDGIIPFILQYPNILEGYIQQIRCSLNTSLDVLQQYLCVSVRRSPPTLSRISSLSTTTSKSSSN